MMARSQGAPAQVALAFEGTSGLAAAAGVRQVPYASTSLVEILAQKFL
jgi:hypothetical protein